MLFAKGKRKEAARRLEDGPIPRHVAIIMDGNGRWAQTRGLPRTAGHAAGSETFRKAAYFLQDVGVKYVSIYAFSSENWRRPAEEVSVILQLLEKYLRESLEQMRKKNISLYFWGDLQPLPEGLQQLIAQTTAVSQKNDGMQVHVCLNYGGRAELTRAARRLAEQCMQGQLRPEDITEQHLSDQLYSSGIPDPDLIIRGGGEVRLSNFLLWQSAYSEYYFTDTLWPDMDEQAFSRAILSYQRRNRRFGGLN